MKKMNPLVTAADMRALQFAENVVILDATAKKDIPDPEAYLQIEGARHFDIKNDFSDTGSKYPNMMLPPKAFEAACRKLGIRKDSTILVYDSKGIYTAPRVWWMFRMMGHEAVAVLDGGLPEWKGAGYPLVHQKERAFPEGDFVANFNPSYIRDITFVRNNIAADDALVVDARSAGRFNGTSPEPRAGLPSGHIPYSASFPYTEVLSDGRFKSPEALAALFGEVNPGGKPMVFSCGSGITACILMLAGELANVGERAVYDGSWTEWAQET